jgi:hypothetical protein
MTNFSEIQREFVQLYMDDDRVIGVRIRQIDGQMTLDVEVRDCKAVDLPKKFHDLPVIVREGRKAVLAYC